MIILLTKRGVNNKTVQSVTSYSSHLLHENRGVKTCLHLTIIVLDLDGTTIKGCVLTLPKYINLLDGKTGFNCYG